MPSHVRFYIHTDSKIYRDKVHLIYVQHNINIALSLVRMNTGNYLITFYMPVLWEHVRPAACRVFVCSI